MDSFEENSVVDISFILLFTALYRKHIKYSWHMILVPSMSCELLKIIRYWDESATIPVRRQIKQTLTDFSLVLLLTIETEGPDYPR